MGSPDGLPLLEQHGTVSTLPSDADSGPSNREQGEVLEQLPFKIPPIIQQAQEAFHQALPKLLQERPGQWVAYHGATLIDYGKTKTELYQKCLRQYRRGEFLVRAIRPQLETITIGLR